MYAFFQDILRYGPFDLLYRFYLPFIFPEQHLSRSQNKRETTRSAVQPQFNFPTPFDRRSRLLIAATPASSAPIVASLEGR